jgi:hypothetical protein
MMTMGTTTRCRSRLVATGGWLIFCSIVTLVGCSSVTGVSSKTNSGRPGKLEGSPTPDGSAIAVIPNPYVDDATLANAAADEAKSELTKRGYKVVSSEDQAKLIAIPTVETNFVSAGSISTSPSGEPSLSLSPPVDRPGMLATTFESLPSLSGPRGSGAVKANGKLLVIEAFDKAAWDKALIVNELQLPATWKLRIPLPKDLQPAVEGAAFARSGGDTQFVLPR